MSFASPLLPALHLLVSLGLPLLKTCDASLPSLEMKNLLFVERRSHSTFDLVQEFYNRTLLPLCDVTVNVCDVNCCNDKDCSEEDLETFSCTKEPESFSVDPLLSDWMYCHSNGISKLSDPVLCYETQNSPFLGVYFTEDETLKRKSLEMKLENVPPQRYFLPTKTDHPLPDRYKYGVPLRFTEERNAHLPSEILGKGYCDYHSPIRFLEDSDSVCTSEISAEQCVSNTRFHLSTYFKENHGRLELTEIVSGGEVPLATNITIQCGHDIFEIEDFYVVSEVFEACSNATKISRAQYDDRRQLCQHVVTQVEYHFIWDGDTLVALHVLASLSDISTAPNESSVPSRKGRNPRVIQRFRTEFHEKEKDSARRRRVSYNLNDEILLHHMS